MTTNFEPTLYDVIELIRNMEIRLINTAQSNFQLLSLRIDNLVEQMVDQKRITTKLIFRVEEIYDELRELNDSNARKIKNHEKRITKLEARPV